MEPAAIQRLERDRAERAAERDRKQPLWLPYPVEVWGYRTPDACKRYREFLTQPIPYRGANRQPNWEKQPEKILEVARPAWARAVQNRDDVFFGQRQGQFIRAAPREDGLGFAALPIPFAENELSGLFEHFFDWVEEQTLMHDWPPPVRLNKSDVWRPEDLPSGRHLFNPPAGGEVFALFGNHACNFHIVAGPWLQNVLPTDRQDATKFAEYSGKLFA